MHWNPIETAPKDGTQIILYQKEQLVHFYGVGKWVNTSYRQLEEIETKGNRVISEWVEHVDGHWDVDNIYLPTHWAEISPPEGA